MANGSELSFPWWGRSRSACGVRCQSYQGRRATASVNVLHAGRSADISPFMSLRRSPNALGRRHRFRLLWLERPACRAGGVALRRVGVSRAGRKGRAGGCPARNHTERGTPARRGAAAQHPRAPSSRQQKGCVASQAECQPQVQRRSIADAAGWATGDTPALTEPAADVAAGVAQAVLGGRRCGCAEAAGCQATMPAALPAALQAGLQTPLLRPARHWRPGATGFVPRRARPGVAHARVHAVGRRGP